MDLMVMKFVFREDTVNSYHIVYMLVKEMDIIPNTTR